jgi:acetoin utilization deacetylase AcuC-like enzyme
VISIFSAAHTMHDPPFEFLDGALVPVYESPARAAIIHAALERAALGPILPPRTFGIEHIRAVHSNDYLDYLEQIYARWVAAGGAPASVMPGTLAVRWMSRRCDHPVAAPGYYCFDMSAPIVAGTYAAARAAAHAAVTGAALLLEGQRVAYALCRPPGHHAGRDMCGGYCYLNNAAIAAQYLLRSTTDHRPLTSDPKQDKETSRSGELSNKNILASPSSGSHLSRSSVAILDIDYHHGNGTQQIFYERGDVLFVSIHADPARQYPYFAGYADERGASDGLGANLNIPLEAGVADERYLAALDEALVAVRAFDPRFLVVSAGFDTFGGDPIADFALSTAAYPRIGRRIAALELPTLIVQEGGYAVDALGENAVGFLRAFESA